MSAPDPEGISLLAKVVAAGAAVIAPLWGAWTWLDKRLEKKADKVEVEATAIEFREEFKTHRSYFAKVFDQMRENEQRAQDRHERLMEKMADLNR